MEIQILEKTYDFIKWYVPILNQIPRSNKYTLGNRLVTNFYTFLEGLIQAQYSREKRSILTNLNTQLEVIRYETRLIHDLELLSPQRYEYTSKLINEIGLERGGWIRHQKKSPCPSKIKLGQEDETIRLLVSTHGNVSSVQLKSPALLPRSTTSNPLIQTSNPIALHEWTIAPLPKPIAVHSIAPINIFERFA